MTRDKWVALFWFLMMVGAATLIFGISTGSFSWIDLWRIVCAVAGVEFVDWLRDREANGKWWRCSHPGCTFRARSNDQSAMWQVKWTHEMSHDRRPPNIFERGKR